MYRSQRARWRISPYFFLATFAAATLAQSSAFAASNSNLRAPRFEKLSLAAGSSAFGSFPVGMPRGKSAAKNSLREHLSRTIETIDRVVVVGGLRIDVVAMECGLTKVGSGDATLRSNPGSQWCLIRVDVKNVSSAPAFWSAGGETGYDPRGSSFSSESLAELYVSNSNLFGSMNPGVSAPDVIPFELPSNDKLVRVTFPAGFTGDSASISLK